MEYTFTDRFAKENREFLMSAMMGPNSMRVSEELAWSVPIKPGARVLDLGCGMGLSSIFLAERFGATVFAADLWINPTENHGRFEAMGLSDRVIPLSCDVTKGLPFAEGYFDVIFTVDSYHYYGGNREMLPALIKHLKPGGHIAIAIPGIRFEFGKHVPEEMKPYWDIEDVERTIHSMPWWKKWWEMAEGIETTSLREMDCCADAWREWLESPNPYAVSDIEMMKAEGGKYFNLIQFVAKKI